MLILSFIIVILLFGGFFVISAIKVLPSFRFNKHSAKYRPFSNSDFAISRDEWHELPVLERLHPFTNRYSKQQALMLYFTVRRKYPQIKTQKRASVVLCEKAVLRELGCGNCLTEDIAWWRQQLDDAVWKAIDENAEVLVTKITGDEDKSFYDAYGDAWKIRIRHLQDTFSERGAAWYYDQILHLAALNNERVTMEREIYFTAYQDLAGKDRELALKLYLYYLNVKTFSETFRHRKLPVRDHKILFKKQGEKERFDAICTGLLQHKQIDKALEEFDRMQISQRKKIALDIQAIKQVAEKQSKVAGVLSEWLADEDEPVRIPVQSGAGTADIPVAEPPGNHKDALFRLFIHSIYKVNKEEVDIFARSCGVFPGQLIERINEEYYEELDDVLIEEEDDHYVMNEEYYQQIKEDGD